MASHTTNSPCTLHYLRPRKLGFYMRVVRKTAHHEVTDEESMKLEPGYKVTTAPIFKDKEAVMLES